MKNKVIKVYIKDCLKDAIEFYVNIKRYEHLLKSNQIIITFSVNGQKKNLISNQNKILNNKYYLKFIGKDVKVLYSQKNDDVLFLKNEV